MDESICTLEITSQVVERRKRFGTLHRTLGPYAYQVEMLSYSIADRLIDGYNGGDWDYVEVSNGGMFAYIDEERFFLQSMNGSEYELSGEAAGLTVWLFASSWGAEKFEGNQDLQSALVSNYDKLRNTFFVTKRPARYWPCAINAPLNILPAFKQVFFCLRIQ